MADAFGDGLKQCLGDVDELEFHQALELSKALEQMSDPLGGAGAGAGVGGGGGGSGARSRIAHALEHMSVTVVTPGGDLVQGGREARGRRYAPPAERSALFGARIVAHERNGIREFTLADDPVSTDEDTDTATLDPDLSQTWPVPSPGEGNEIAKTGRATAKHVLLASKSHGEGIVQVANDPKTCRLVKEPGHARPCTGTLDCQYCKDSRMFPDAMFGDGGVTGAGSNGGTGIGRGGESPVTHLAAVRAIVLCCIRYMMSPFVEVLSHAAYHLKRGAQDLGRAQADSGVYSKRADELGAESAALIKTLAAATDQLNRVLMSARGSSPGTGSVLANVAATGSVDVEDVGDLLAEVSLTLGSSGSTVILTQTGGTGSPPMGGNKRRGGKNRGRR
jgi:hypothetical protein